MCSDQIFSLKQENQHLTEVRGQGSGKASVAWGVGLLRLDLTVCAELTLTHSLTLTGTVHAVINKNIQSIYKVQR